MPTQEYGAAAFCCYLYEVGEAAQGALAVLGAGEGATESEQSCPSLLLLAAVACPLLSTFPVWLLAGLSLRGCIFI